MSWHCDCGGEECIALALVGIKGWVEAEKVNDLISTKDKMRLIDLVMAPYGTVTHYPVWILEQMGYTIDKETENAD